jgi:hypothetical protein
VLEKSNDRRRWEFLRNVGQLVPEHTASRTRCLTVTAVIAADPKGNVLRVRSRDSSVSIETG